MVQAAGGGNPAASGEDVPARLGATLGDGQCAFAVFSDVAPATGGVFVCLMDPAGEETQRVAMTAGTGGVWTAVVAGVVEGQRYGYRVHGTVDAADGDFYDPTLLLLDPYARAYAPVSEAAPRSLHSLVIGQTPPPPPCTRRGLADTVIYETHVKGLSRLHPGVDPGAQGTFLGVGSAAILDHLEALGVTAVELMPVHQFVSEPFLLDQGLTDYWGYATVGFFAPHAAYSAAGPFGQQVAEFKAMVGALHARGIEVILDVVFNHTGEGGPGQPALSFRGLANDVYYWLEADPAIYVDITGTGNTIDPKHPQVVALISDSLIYWADEMGVDGFRFDEAAALARTEGSFEGGSSPFVEAVNQVAAARPGLKLIAEPWDESQDPGNLGRFPEPWSEWNAGFRDGVPSFWARSVGLEAGGSGDLGGWLTGSRATFGDQRTPLASINYVACHDGLTTADKVAQDADMELPAPSDVAATAAVTGRRLQRQRNLIATSLVSQGVPMLLGGDELSRSQGGNPNAYNIDGPVTWYDWTDSPAKTAMGAFVALAIAVRRDLAALRQPTALFGGADSRWYDLGGNPMSAGEWGDPGQHGAGLWISGTFGTTSGPDVLLILNAGPGPAPFTMPSEPAAGWQVRLDSSQATGEPESASVPSGGVLDVPPETLVVLAGAPA